MSAVVHIVDDDSDYRKQVADFLSTSGYRVIQSESADKFLEVFDPEQRGCVLMDERMPGATGSEALEKISRWLSIYPAILVTGFADVPLAVAAMRKGAYDVVEKPCNLESLRLKVQDAVNWNESVWERHSADARVWSDLQTLTSREREILTLIIEGQSSKSIGTRLKISARTVDNHRVHILSKMRAKSLSDLGRAVASASAIFGEGRSPHSTKAKRGKAS